jgi:hypothetical protein
MMLVEAMRHWMPDMLVCVPKAAGGFNYFSVRITETKRGVYCVLMHSDGRPVNRLCLEFIGREDFELVPLSPSVNWRKILELETCDFGPIPMRAMLQTLLQTLPQCLYVGEKVQCDSMHMALPECIFQIVQTASLRWPSDRIKATRNVQWYLDAVGASTYWSNIKFLALDAGVAGNKYMLIYGRTWP